MNFNTIPDDQTYLRPKKATTSNLKGRLVGAAVLSFVIACLATTGTTGASETSIQPVSFASEPAPAANEKPAPAAPAADQKAKPTCGHDNSSPCSAQDFIDILDKEGWTNRSPLQVDPNKNECASNPSAVDSPQGAVAGPKGTGRANGQDYYGVDVDEGCQPETALACGTIECKA